MALQYIVYSDESEEKGPLFSNFYGGLLVRSTDCDWVINYLEDTKASNNLMAELKWQKVTLQYLDKYIRFIDAFMDLVAEDRVKVRVMFRENCWQPQGLTPDQLKNEYFLLYYQFLKHAFGWEYSNPTGQPISLMFYSDQLAEQTKDKKERFKDFIVRLQTQPELLQANLRIRRQDIAEVDSKDHVLLQALDIVMGAVQFTLNEYDLNPCPGNRTLAKIRLSSHILDRIMDMYPWFDPTVSTPIFGNMRNRWLQSYRHWAFIPKSARSGRSKAR